MASTGQPEISRLLDLAAPERPAPYPLAALAGTPTPILWAGGGEGEEMIRVSGGCGLDDQQLGEMARKAADIEIRPEVRDFISLRVDTVSDDAVHSAVRLAIYLDRQNRA